MRILVVEDDLELGGLLVELLQGQQYAVDLAPDGETASELAAVNPYDLIILDWTIPPPSGIELLAEWRASGEQTPVLMLTGRRDIEDRVDGLDAGADDYLVKPFSFEELLARSRSLLRRRSRDIQEFRADDLVLDAKSRRVTVGGVPIELTPKEFGILEFLLSRLDEVVTRTELVEHVWDDGFDAMSNVVDVTIYRLRKRIAGGRPGKLLQTVKGHGYVLKSQRS